jgi:hypothetical protein
MFVLTIVSGELSLDSCEECSVCSSVAPPPPLLLFSGVGGQALSAAGLHVGDECPECQQHATPSFSPSPRRASVPARPCQQEQPTDELAYVYESPRARAKHSLPNVWSARDNAGKTRYAWNIFVVVVYTYCAAHSAMGRYTGCLTIIYFNISTLY